jgi:stress-induced morphogen
LTGGRASAAGLRYTYEDMPTTAETVRSQILAALPDAEVEVRDTTGGGDHFAAVVISPAFAGRLPVERHRLIYAALGRAMQQDIHALALTTLTPEEQGSRAGQGTPPTSKRSPKQEE